MQAGINCILPGTITCCNVSAQWNLLLTQDRPDLVGSIRGPLSEAFLFSSSMQREGANSAKGLSPDAGGRAGAYYERKKPSGFVIL